MSQSKKNLLDAFAGESQANRKYLAFAKQADKEGFPKVARLFRAAAEAETIHAHAHLKAAGGIHTTAENLQAAVSGETFEFETMYPPMIEAAEAEGNKAAARSFSFANEAEKVHAELYQKALDQMDDQQLADVYVCSVCGYICETEPPEACPICKAKAKAFFKVD